MLYRIADNLGWSVKAHRLTVEKGCAKDIRVMAFDVARGIGDQRERSRMALRKAVASESFKLRESLLGEFLSVTVPHHSRYEFVLEARDAAGELESRHRLAQLVGLPAVKPAQTIATLIADS